MFEAEASLRIELVRGLKDLSIGLSKIATEAVLAQKNATSVEESNSLLELLAKISAEAIFVEKQIKLYSMSQSPILKRVR